MKTKKADLESLAVLYAHEAAWHATQGHPASAGFIMWKLRTYLAKEDYRRLREMVRSDIRSMRRGEIPIPIAA